MAVRARFLLPRAGAHHGPAVSRDGDYLGGTVNLAARVAAQASGGHVLVTSAVATAARTRGIEVSELGRHRLHNIAEPVELFEIRARMPRRDRVPVVAAAGIRSLVWRSVGEGEDEVEL
jgi:adenylate cyclase